MVLSFTALVFLFAIFFGMGLLCRFFGKKLADVESRLKMSVQQNEEISRQVQKLIEVYAELKGRPVEVVRREIIKEGVSTNDLLVEAVSRIAPAVVSVVVSKDVPQFEITYVNPFGDDPFFKDFDIRIPQYRRKGTTEQKVGAGTGFIISNQGYIVTNRHLVDDLSARYTVLLSSGLQKEAQVLYRDNEIDIAVLKVEGSGYPTVVLGDSDKLKLGQSVFAIGNALGEYNNSVSVGVISGLNRNLEAFGVAGSEKLRNVIQTDAAINPGNSGGPLANLNGEVVGVNVAYNRNAENIGFSIPINAIKAIIAPYLK